MGLCLLWGSFWKDFGPNWKVRLIHGKLLWAKILEDQKGSECSVCVLQGYWVKFFDEELWLAGRHTRNPLPDPPGSFLVKQPEMLQKLQNFTEIRRKNDSLEECKEWKPLTAHVTEMQQKTTWFFQKINFIEGNCTMHRCQCAVMFSRELHTALSMHACVCAFEKGQHT